jgi:hypothetical protein
MVDLQISGNFPEFVERLEGVVKTTNKEVRERERGSDDGNPHSIALQSFIGWSLHSPMEILYVVRLLSSIMQVSIPSSPFYLTARPKEHHICISQR